MNESYEKKHRGARRKAVFGGVKELIVFLSCVGGSAAQRFVPDLSNPAIEPVNVAQVAATLITAILGYGLDYWKASGDPKALAGRKKNWKTRIIIFFLIGYFALSQLEKFTP